MTQLSSQTLLVFTKETNIRITPDYISYMTTISQYAEGNNYNALNGEPRKQR